MKTFLAFFKKEWLELLRTGRLMILAAIFVLFGVMNLAIAKLTPWLMETLSDSLAESGMTVTAVTVDAMTSWTQFYKNIPMALIIFALMLCGTLTNECRDGTLIPVLTKGLSRCKVVCAKAATLSLLWIFGYAVCFFITYGYNALYWDNAIALNLFPAALSYFLFGLWVISLITLFSSFSPASTGVLLGAGGSALLTYLLGMIPALAKYMPIKLTEGMRLLSGAAAPVDMLPAAVVSIALIIVNIIVAIPVFDRRRI